MAADEGSCAVDLILNKGVYLKGLMALYKEAKIPNVTLTFEKDNITIVELTQSKDGQRILSDTAIKSKNTIYQYNHTAPDINFCMDTKDANTALGNCGRNDSVSIFILSNKLDQIGLRFDSAKASSSQDNLHVITACQSERKQYIRPTYTSERTVVGSMGDFETVIGNIKRSRPTTVTIKCEVNAEGLPNFVFERDNSKNTAVSMYTFGKVVEVPTETLTFTLGLQAIMVLKKLIGACNRDDNISITMEKDINGKMKPLRLNISTSVLEHTNYIFPYEDK